MSCHLFQAPRKNYEYLSVFRDHITASSNFTSIIYSTDDFNNYSVRRAAAAHSTPVLSSTPEHVALLALVKDAKNELRRYGCRYIDAQCSVEYHYCKNGAQLPFAMHINDYALVNYPVHVVKYYLHKTVSGGDLAVYYDNKALASLMDVKSTDEHIRGIVMRGDILNDTRPITSVSGEYECITVHISRTDEPLYGEERHAHLEQFYKNYAFKKAW